MKVDSWNKIYDFSAKDLSPNDTYWSEYDTILNELEELPLEDLDREKIPSVMSEENTVEKVLEKHPMEELHTAGKGARDSK
jgi:hypothetical protein